MSNFARRIEPYVTAELECSARAASQGDQARAFAHLERAHVLGQASTTQHLRVHLRMLAWAIRQRRIGEALGQLVRIFGAATKTAVGLVPTGNTGGANVSPFKRMPIPADLAEILDSVRMDQGHVR